MNFQKLLTIQPELLIRIAGNIVFALLAIFIAKYIIRVVFNALKRPGALSSYQSRVKTLKSLINNVVTIGLVGITTLMSLRDMGYDITPILTGAGILGLAVSFGAQTLVKDLIAGFFIIVENQYNVGDEVQIDDIKGKVRKINIRSTVLTDKSGGTIYIPNSKVEIVKVLKERA